MEMNYAGASGFPEETTRRSTTSLGQTTVHRNTRQGHEGHEGDPAKEYFNRPFEGRDDAALQIMQSYVHVILAGLSSGCSSGSCERLTLIFGVLGVLNFATAVLHGWAYCSFTVLKYLGRATGQASFWAPACARRVLVERFFLRHVYRIALPYQLLLTFAFVLIFDNPGEDRLGGGRSRPPPFLPAGRFRSWSSFPVYNLFIIAVGPAVASSWGPAGEDVYADHPASSRTAKMRPAGVGPGPLHRVFVFGTWLGALGGGLAVPMWAADPRHGETIIIEAFIVAVIGLGSLKGAFVGPW